jgi:hypothetical protein
MMFPMEGRPDGYYPAGEVHFVPRILTCFGCRTEMAKDLDPAEVVYAFALDPWGAGYAHIRCLPPDFKAKVDAQEATRGTAES